LTSWVFEAGPFAVDVKGTTFVLAWSAAAGRLDLQLEQGLLAIHAPFSSQPISLQGGQRLIATTRDGRFFIRALSAPERESAVGSAPAPATESASAPPASAAAGRASGAPASSATTRSAWADYFAASNFGAIVADAEQQGLDRALGQRSLAELALLADAA